MSDPDSLRLGVIGDLHSHWDEMDVAQFRDTDYDLLLFTGDLGGGTPASSLRMARVMAQLDKPALVMPGNNDTGDIAELSAELSHRRGIRRLTAVRSGALAADAEDPVEVRLCGYSLHRQTRGDVDLTILAGRPHSLGGNSLAFPEHMRRTYGIESLAESRDRLLALVREVETERLLFFAHNGPSGLGAEPHDIWGCDFKLGGGDWGDPDLTEAIAAARLAGHRVLAVIAGHMHLRTRTGRERPWLVERDGIRYVNAARVPRIFARDGSTHRHHVALTVTGAGVEAREVLVDA